MKISLVELRRDTKKLLDALERREEITLTRRGRAVATIRPAGNEEPIAPEEHPAFGMWANRKDLENPTEAVKRGRQSRYHDL